MIVLFYVLAGEFVGPLVSDLFAGCLPYARRTDPSRRLCALRRGHGSIRDSSCEERVGVGQPERRHGGWLQLHVDRSSRMSFLRGHSRQLHNFESSVGLRTDNCGGASEDQVEALGL